MIGEKMFEESSLRIGYIICFVTAVGFVCSLTYNCGYFWLFNAGVRVLSIGDILTSYTLWVPGLGMLLFGYCLDLFLQRVEQKDKIIKSIKHRKFIKRLIGLPHYIIFIAMITLLISYVLFGFLYRPIVVWFSCCYVWLSFAAYLSSLQLFAGRANKFILWIFLFIPVVLSLMFAIGMDKALDDAKLNAPNIKLFFLDEGNTPHPAILLRHLEKGLLAKEIDQNNYILYTWEDLSRIEILASKSHFQGIACEWFKLHCVVRNLP